MRGRLEKAQCQDICLHVAYVLEEAGLCLNGCFTCGGTPHSPLRENASRKHNYHSSSSIPVNPKVSTEFLLAEKHEFFYKYFPQQ